MVTQNKQGPKLLLSWGILEAIASALELGPSKVAFHALDVLWTMARVDDVLAQLAGHRRLAALLLRLQDTAHSTASEHGEFISRMAGKLAERQAAYGARAD